MKKLLITIVIALAGFGAFCQNVRIPDPEFKKYLVDNTAINTNSDTEIQVAEAAAFTGKIDVSDKNIASLTGIEAFVKITFLNCSGNQLSTLDVSQNTALTTLVCSRNQLCTLDVSGATALTDLFCSENQLSTLDVSQNTALTKLVCWDNQLTTLDVSQNTQLNTLACYRNGKLKAINIKNGNGVDMEDFNIRSNNTSLTCVQVDDAVAFKKKWAKRFTDAGIGTDIISENCFVLVPVLVTAIATDRIEDRLILYPNPAGEVLTITTSDLVIEEMTIENIAGSTVRTIDKDVRSVDISSLHSGTYLLRINTTRGTLLRRFIKE